MFLSICITSYNRVSEIDRLLKSIDCFKHKDDIEIIVSEDKSPKKDEIEKVVTTYKNNSPFKVVFNSNVINQGYDRNLGVLKQIATGDYVLYMSDDDVFLPNILDSYIDYLVKNKCDLCFQPYLLNKRVYRKYPQNKYFDANEKNIADHIYDSILFSGLTFKRSRIVHINAEPFLNTYYFQVFMFLKVGYKYGFFYYNQTLVDSICDGENGYGLSDSSIKNIDLANRNSIFSNLEFNIGLFKVITIFDQENLTHCKSIFSKEYSIRTLPGMIKARKISKDTYIEYLKRLNYLGAEFTFIFYIYRFSIAVLGVSLSEKIFNIPKTILLRVRKGANTLN